jgi:hypothetical protein
VFVRQPQGFENPKYPNRVYKISKTLYGLKQAPRAWYARLKTFLLEPGYVMGSVDKTLFTLKCGNDFLLVQIYVDDIIFDGSSHTLVSGFQEMMEKKFQMSMMGELTFFLGIQVNETKQCTFVHQAKYMKDLMKKFNMAEHKPVSTPMSTATVLDTDENGEVVDQKEYRSMIGSLMYLTAIRSDIQFVVCLYARYQTSSRSSHRTAVQRIFRYLKYTLEFRIWYSASYSLDLVGFSDADFAGCGVDRKHTYGTCYFFRSSLVCWSIRKQSFITQSTTESEYIATASYCFQILWIVYTMRDYEVTYKSVPLMCDNSSVICLAQNPFFYGRAKHIKVRHHFLRDHVVKGDIVMKCIETERQLADIFTKPLDAFHFASLRGGLVFAIPMTWFEGELVLNLIYTPSSFHRIAFHHIYLIYLLLHFLY